jgi:hypothetical protein
VAEPLQCGVASAVFASNTAAAATAAQTDKLAFWWNWNIAPYIDTTQLDASVANTLNNTFVPMVWGTAPEPTYDFLGDKSG